ncbi:theronine dehydrogenase [Rhizodiscina lignyota]|uniref:Theronine dehydrogenase n=1 Tax=Rhizodiscina lignyota TaxID=1504668 RepID=A0A9P4I848_9PEZI|nr:theronine dehydrogenase [Rhizodiscina lignyota]
MKALVFNGKSDISIVDKPQPKLVNPTDAIVKVDYTTICGTDLHIIKGDVPETTPGTTLGHEGVGTIEEAGSGVSKFKVGDKVLLSCISSCGTCEYCRRGMSSHCTTGGWILGHTIDGTQAEYVRIPHADSSLYQVPQGVDPKTLVMLSDIFPTGFECGVLNGKVQPGSTVAIIGAGPVGLAAFLTSQLYSPSWVLMIDPDQNRLKVAQELGVQYIAEPNTAQKVVDELTDGKGCDTIIEAVGIPATFEQCQQLVAPGGVIANVGVHGSSVELHLETLWAKNVSITTRLVDAVTTPTLLKMVVAGKLPAEKLITHHFKFSDMIAAYSNFQNAATQKTLKVLIEM